MAVVAVAAVVVAVHQIFTCYNNRCTFRLKDRLILLNSLPYKRLYLIPHTLCLLYTSDIKELFLLAIATSIDALAVGVTFAFLQVNIVPAIIIIGSVTFVISAAGVFIGNIFGSKYKSRAELAGGIILILLGIKILLEHLGIV